MSSRSSTPELVIVDDEDDEFDTLRPPNENKAHAQQRQLQLQLRNNPDIPPPELAIVSRSAGNSATTNGVLQEIVDILQWVNTGMRRETRSEKTFIEMEFEEMAKQLEESKIQLEESKTQLEEAQLEICVLKQIKSQLETEKRGLAEELERERSEKMMLDHRLDRVKEAARFLDNCLEDTLMSPDSPEFNQYQEMPTVIFGFDKDREDVSEGVNESQTNSGLNLHQDVTEDVGSSGSVNLKQSGIIHTTCNTSTLPFDVGYEAKSLGASSLMLLIDSSDQEGKYESSNEEVKKHEVDRLKQQLGAYCLCGLKFSNKRSLDSHIVYHTCEKKFACTICQKRFVGSNYLKGHMLRCHKVSYTGGSNGCRDCGKTFATLLQLRRHKKLVHFPPVKGLNITKVERSKTKVAVVRAKTHRHSVRMRQRHQSGEGVRSALKMLQGDCSDCQFCREQRQKKMPCRQSRNSKPSPSQLLAAFPK